MSVVKHIVVLIVCLKVTLAFTNELCIQERTLSYIKTRSLKKLKDDPEVRIMMESLMKSKGNFSLNALLLTLITNFDLLPTDLQDELRLCTVDSAYLESKCASAMEGVLCENLNHFSYGFACPMGYVREDQSRCVRDCKIQDNSSVTIIDSNCKRLKSRILDILKKYDSYEECIAAKKTECAKDPSKDKWMESCMIHEKQILFICMPYCWNELTKEQIEALKSSPRYCVKDYIFLGTPIRDS